MEIDILGYDGQYAITKEGDVFSYKYNKKRKLKPQRATQSKKGYFQVRLFTGQGDTLGKLYYVHRLVYETFKGDIPENKQIDHIDGDTSNNSVDNLQLLTPRKNMAKYNIKKHGPSLRSKRDYFIKLYEQLGTYDKVAEATGVSYQRIYRVIKDIVHYKDHKSGKWLTRRWSDIDDEYTRYDRRRNNIPPHKRKKK